MPRTFFVTGTDTGVGKTVVAAGILRAARRRGLAVAGIKPVAAGCQRVDGRLRNDDALQLAREAGGSLVYEDVNPVALEPPIAPHVAARRSGVDLSAASLVRHCEGIGQGPWDLVVIEGAGGWLVPLAGPETLADVSQRLGADVVLVVGMKLGCLNHALLTAADVGRRGLVLAGWVANELSHPPMEALEENVETLRERLSGPCLGRVPWVPRGRDPVEAVVASLDLAPLLPPAAETVR